MHRNTGRTQPVIVEYGFIDDTPDKVKYLQDNYKQSWSQRQTTYRVYLARIFASSRKGG